MIKRMFFRFTRTVYVMDLRDSAVTRCARCSRFERRNHTNGKRSVFA